MRTNLAVKFAATDKSAAELHSAMNLTSQDLARLGKVESDGNPDGYKVEALMSSQRR